VLRSARDAEFTEFVAARMTALRRVAYLLCQDWHRADDLVQVAITKLYANWHRAWTTPRPTSGRSWSGSNMSERRSGWARACSRLVTFPTGCWTRLMKMATAAPAQVLSSSAWRAVIAI